MNRRFTTLFLLSLFSLGSTVSYSQESGGGWGLGFSIGGQKLYGDRRDVGIGLGAEGFVSYGLLGFADLSLAFGYGQLKYDVNQGPIGSNSTNMFTGDLKTNIEVISNGSFRPFITLGLGVVNFKVSNSGRGRFFDASLISGGGLRVRLSSRVDWILAADYRLTTGDSFDSVTLNSEGKSNDGYLNLRAGISYNIRGQEEQEMDIIADQRAPLEEVSDPAAGVVKAENGQGQNLEEKNTREYANLKSRVDALSESVTSKEDDIEKLQKTLQDRKQQIASMEKGAANRKPVSLTKRNSMSGFSEIYEEALTNYYNKNHTEAITLFELLLQQYPDHALASNCQFWIGQSYFALARYDESIDAFYKVLSYDRSLKKDDSLYFLGKTHLKTGAGERAKEVFSRLVRNYPNSEFIEEARSYLQKL